MGDRTCERNQAKNSTSPDGRENKKNSQVRTCERNQAKNSTSPDGRENQKKFTGPDLRTQSGQKLNVPRRPRKPKKIHRSGPANAIRPKTQRAQTAAKTEKNSVGPDLRTQSGRKLNVPRRPRKPKKIQWVRTCERNQAENSTCPDGHENRKKFSGS